MPEYVTLDAAKASRRIAIPHIAALVQMSRVVKMKS